MPQFPPVMKIPLLMQRYGTRDAPDIQKETINGGWGGGGVSHSIHSHKTQHCAKHVQSANISDHSSSAGQPAI